LLERKKNTEKALNTRDLSHDLFIYYCWPVLYVSGGSKNFEKGAEGNLSAPSSFIANAHNEIYAFYTEKSGSLKKI